MTLNLFICLAAGILGIIFHLLIKANALKKRAQTANEPFSLLQYLAKDWLSILISLVTVIIVIFASDEIIGYKPIIAKYIKWFFIAVGYMGSSILQSVLSRSERQILTVIDKKTNLADRVITEGTASVSDIEQVQQSKNELTGKK